MITAITITGSLTNMISFTEAAANGGLLLAGLFGAMFLYVFITDSL